MAINTEKNTYTLLFAVGLVVIVGTLLAAIDSSLKDKIRINEILEKQQNILYAIGINENEGNNVSFIAAEKAEEEFNKYITKQIYIQGDEVIEDNKAYLIDVKKQKTLAKDPSHKRKLPLFLAQKDGRNLYVAPIRGKGLWDAIWAYVSVDENMVIRGIYFDHKAETPGLGARISSDEIQDRYKGKEIFDIEGNLISIKMLKKENNPALSIHEVDGMSGATITANGLNDMMKNYLDCYLPFILKNKKLDETLISYNE